MGHMKLVCYIRFNQKTSGFYMWLRAINFVVENDQPLGNVLMPPQFGIKLLIIDVFLEKCTLVWGNK